VGIEVAKEVPETVAGGLHRNGRRLTGVDSHGTDVLVILPNIISVPVHDMSVKTHIPDVPNSVLVLTHLKRWAVGIDIAIELVEWLAQAFRSYIEQIALRERSWAGHQS
jgi:hypothetical protein